MIISFDSLNLSLSSFVFKSSLIDCLLMSLTTHCQPQSELRTHLTPCSYRTIVFVLNNNQGITSKTDDFRWFHWMVTLWQWQFKNFGDIIIIIMRILWIRSPTSQIAQQYWLIYKSFPTSVIKIGVANSPNFTEIWLFKRILTDFRAMINNVSINQGNNLHNKRLKLF